MTKASGPRVFVYARSSLQDRERHALSIRQQVRSTRFWLNEHQAELVCIFVEHGPLLDIRCRPVVTSMLDLIRSAAAPADTILVDLPQRISRYFPEYVGVRAELGALGIRLIATDDLHGHRLREAIAPAG